MTRGYIRCSHSTRNLPELGAMKCVLQKCSNERHDIPGATVASTEEQICALDKVLSNLLT